jgi:hypothetical protein
MLLVGLPKPRLFGVLMGLLPNPGTFSVSIPPLRLVELPIPVPTPPRALLGEPPNPEPLLFNPEKASKAGPGP